jgi:hypothetical protein
MDMDNVVVFYAFRYCLGRKGLALSHICRYIEKHIEEIPNLELQECDHELREAYKNFEDTGMSGFLIAKRLHTSIQRELYGIEEE